MITVNISTYNSENFEMEIAAMPQLGHYIHYDDRVFIIESVIHQQNQKTHLSVIELV